ncbi:MAG: 4Fe-4S binding protein [Candidatus Bathyarchaeota archaeon]|nr:4Fe-4S binding protein [Candidatus Bathyarchaeota archaeon]
MRVRLTYSPEVVEKPVLAEVILKAGLPINIIDAKINAQKGELVVSIPATGKKLEKVLALFKKEGVQVQKFTKVLQIDYDRCTSCGACISPCLTKALRFGSDWTLEFDEEKCVACGTCITVCPVKAIAVP